MSEEGDTRTRATGVGGRSPLLVVFTTVFIDLLGFGIIIPILPFYAEHYGASEALVGMLFASYSLMQFLFAPMWGRTSDSIGRRPVLLISLAGTSVAFVVFGLAQSLAILFVGRILAGVFGAVITTAYAYIGDVTTEENRAHGMGLIGAAFGLGFIFGPFIGGVMAHLWGYSAPAYFAAGLAFCNMVLAWFVFPESFPKAAREAARSKRAEREGRTISLIRIWRAIRKPRVGTLLLLFFLVTFAFSNMEATYSLLTQDLFGWGARENGYMFGFIGIVMVIVQGGLIRPLSKRFGEHRLIVTGTLALIPGLGLLPFSPGLGILMILSGIMAAGSGITTPSVNSLISQTASADEQGGIFGINQSLGSLARVLGPVWGGFVFDAISPAAPYWTAAVLMAVAAGVAIHLLRVRGQEASTAVAAETGRGRSD